AQLGGQLHEVEALEQLLDRLGAHVGLEGFAEHLAGLAVFLLRQELTLLELRVGRVDDDVVLEVNDLFQAGRFHIEERAQAAGHGLGERDVDGRRGQLDVAHAFAADAAVRHLDAAAVADHAFVFHAAVLAAGAFPVLLRPKNTLTKQPVFFRPVGAIVDGLRLLDLAEGPTADVMRAGQADAHSPVVVDAVVTGFTRTHGTHSLQKAAKWCTKPGRGRRDEKSQPSWLNWSVSRTRTGWRKVRPLAEFVRSAWCSTRRN